MVKRTRILEDEEEEVVPGTLSGADADHPPSDEESSSSSESSSEGSDNGDDEEEDDEDQVTDDEGGAKSVRPAAAGAGSQPPAAAGGAASAAAPAAGGGTAASATAVASPARVVKRQKVMGSARAAAGPSTPASVKALIADVAGGVKNEDGPGGSNAANTTAPGDGDSCSGLGSSRLLVEFFCGFADFVTGFAQSVAEKHGVAWTPGAGRSKSGKAKTPRDPNMPRGPPNAYMLFCESVRRSYRDVHPEKTLSQSELSEMWRKTSPDQKERFEAASRERKEEYARRMKVYKETLAAKQ